MITGEALERSNEIRRHIKGAVPSPYTEAWTAVKLLEGDEEIRGMIKERLPTDRWQAIDRVAGSSHALLAADSRYEWVQKVIAASAVKAPGKKEILAKRHRFDSVATHPVWGIPVAFGIMFLAMVAAVSIGYLALPCMNAVAFLADGVRVLLEPGPDWVSSMMADGIIVGVGLAVTLSFFLMAVFIVMGFLEDIGYLPRLAYLFDSFMQHLGLHGKSFMPFLMGAGCNIAGVLGSRVIDSWKQRLITLLLIPIIPCFAIWAIVSFIGTIFFGVKTPLVVMALLITAALHLALTSFLLRRFIVKGKSTGLIMELPPYHRPNFKTIWNYAWTNEKAYLKRGFSIIALASFLIWFLAYFPNGNMETSFLSATGKFLNPIGNLMGFDWRLMVALIVAMLAKESALAAIAIIYGIGPGLSQVTGMAVTKSDPGFEHEALGSILMQTTGPEAALAFLFALTFSIPCSATIGVMYSETKSLKWTAGAATYYTLTSLATGILVYHAALFIF